MENCIFCKIIKGQIPSEKVYEDSDFLAFMSISPESPGHALIIPKEHHTWVWDVPNAGRYFETAKKVALAEKKAFGTDFILSKIIGEEVPHAHIHIYPGKGAGGDKMDLAENAERIRKELK